jgi:acyl carrier protein
MTIDSAEFLRRVWEKAAELGGVSPEDIDPDSTLESLGLNSSDAVILAMEIEDVTGQAVDVGIFLRHETIAQAVEEIRQMLAEGGQGH